MTERAVPTLNKLPFLIADAVLIVLALWILFSQPRPLAPWPLALLVVCVAGGAWFAVMACLVEYRAAVRLAESHSLAATVAQIENLHSIGEHISRVTAQWQTVQEHAGKSLTDAKAMGDRMAAESRQFAEFMGKANDAEKAHLRLEVEKLRRGEGEWLQLVVHLLDHVFALYQAAVRSGQPNVREQMVNFQKACREAARRVGLAAFEAEEGEPFDGERHQLPDAGTQPPADAVISATLATGFTYQGRMIRRTLVTLQPTEATSVMQKLEGHS